MDKSHEQVRQGLRVACREDDHEREPGADLCADCYQLLHDDLERRLLRSFEEKRIDKKGTPAARARVLADAVYPNRNRT